MAIKAKTANFHEMTLDIETAPGVYTRVCGLTQRGINRAHNIQETEVPYCDDESLPAAVEIAVQSSTVTINASGAWAAQSHELMLQWWRSGQSKNIRIGHLRAEPGDIEYEMGPALLTSLNNEAQRGQKVTAEVEIRFDGMPTTTVMASSS